MWGRAGCQARPAPVSLREEQAVVCHVRKAGLLEEVAMGPYSWAQVSAIARQAFWLGAEGEYRLETDAIVWFSPPSGHAWRHLEPGVAPPQQGWRHADGCYCDLCADARRGG